MLWKNLPKEELLQMLKDENIGIRKKYRIRKFLGISKKKTEQAKTKPKDPYKYSKGQWV